MIIDDATPEDTKREEVSSIKEGRPITRVKSPINLVRDLAVSQARGGKLDFRSRVAACLSLWSSNRLQSPERTLYDIKIS